MNKDKECAMNRVVCPNCDSENIAAEKRPGGWFHCLDCHYSWQPYPVRSGFDVSPLHKQTVFETITQSPMMLAKSAVYCLSSDLCRANDGKFTVKRNWKSPFIDRCYDTEEAAIAATLARLKESVEVEVEPTAN